MPEFAVSLDVLLFLFAIWSVIAASAPGSATIASSDMEPQLAACDVFAGPAEGQQGSDSLFQDRAGKLAGDWHTGWLGAGMQDLYSWALLMGASYS